MFTNSTSPESDIRARWSQSCAYLNLVLYSNRLATDFGSIIAPLTKVPRLTARWKPRTIALCVVGGLKTVVLLLTTFSTHDDTIRRPGSFKDSFRTRSS